MLAAGGQRGVVQRGQFGQVEVGRGPTVEGSDVAGPGQGRGAAGQERVGGQGQEQQGEDQAQEQ